jgi:hypothetical protein
VAMFDYLGVLISVILGMAITHLLKGVNRLIQLRRRVRIYWVHLVWTLNVLIYVLGIWWGMFWWKHLETWSIEQFLFLAAYAIVLFLLAGTLYPAEMPEDLHCATYFEENRRWFFAIWTIAFLFDIPETLLKGTEHLRDVPIEYAVFEPLSLAIGVVGFATANRRVQAVLCVLWLVAVLAYLGFTSLGHIAG